MPVGAGQPKDPTLWAPPFPTAHPWAPDKADLDPPASCAVSLGWSLRSELFVPLLGAVTCAYGSSYSGG